MTSAWFGQLASVSRLSAECTLIALCLRKCKNQAAPPLDDFGAHHRTIKHLFKTLSSTPDLYLDELQLELQEKFGVSVSLSTIWRTLRKGGYSMKKVNYQSSGR